MITQEKAIEKIKKNECIVKYDKYWRYPKMNDTQKTCPMLDFMFQAEQKAGLLIFIPED